MAEKKTKKKSNTNGGKIRLRNDKNKVVKTSLVDAVTGAAKKNRSAEADKTVRKAVGKAKAKAAAKAKKPSKKK